MSGLGAGAVLAWARALGEFGATILFAGSLAGVTETVPIAIYLGFAQSLDQALALGALLIAVSAVVLVSAQAPDPRHGDFALRPPEVSAARLHL